MAWCDRVGSHQMGCTYLEVAAVEGTVGVDDHEGKVPAEDVLVVGLRVAWLDKRPS